MAGNIDLVALLPEPRQLFSQPGKNDRCGVGSGDNHGLLRKRSDDFGREMSADAGCEFEDGFRVELVPRPNVELKC